MIPRGIIIPKNWESRPGFPRMLALNAASLGMPMTDGEEYRASKAPTKTGQSSKLEFRPNLSFGVIAASVGVYAPGPLISAGGSVINYGSSPAGGGEYWGSAMSSENAEALYREDVAALGQEQADQIWSTYEGPSF